MMGVFFMEGRFVIATDQMLGVRVESRLRFPHRVDEDVVVIIVTGNFFDGRRFNDAIVAKLSDLHRLIEDLHA